LLFIRRFDFFPRSTDAPLLTSLFFAVHPIHCEAVAGIVGRADVLAAMVVLIGILLHDSYEVSENDIQGCENTAMTVGCTVIATCFKETGIMLPSILIAFVLLHSKKFGDYWAICDGRHCERFLCGMTCEEERCSLETKNCIADDPHRGSEHSKAVRVIDFRRYNRALMVSLGITVLILHTTRTYKRNMDWRDEESLYKSALKLNPPKAYSNLGRVYASQMRFDEAEAAYKSAIHYRPNMADTWYNLGVLYQEKKMSNKSIECYEISIGIRKTFAVAYLNLGIVYEEIGDRQRSMSIWQACADIDGSMIKAQREHQNAQTSCRFRLGKMLIQERSLTRAQLILEENRTAESNIYFSKALATAPYLAEVHHHIGLAAASRGDVAGAEAAYKNALKLVGTHRVTLTALATLLREQGRYDRSEEDILGILVDVVESCSDFAVCFSVLVRFVVLVVLVVDVIVLSCSITITSSSTSCL
uniref:Dolichyl-phosphate-mannose--protein mannosyltransferase n=1 Tax=Angiostrongylus cantonensis TaxID=6313 RepID=A0A0K0DNJ5_ANGCA